MNGGVQRILLLSSLFMAAWPVTPARAGGGCHSAGPQSAQPRAGTTVDMEGMCFLPGVLAVAPGATVRFTNYDDVAHVVVGTGWGSTTPLAEGQAVEHRFDEAGTYAYSCYLHPGMNGAVVVGQSGPPAPAALAASSTTTDGVDFRLLALGGVGGALIGGAAGRRLTLRHAPQERPSGQFIAHGQGTDAP